MYLSPLASGFSTSAVLGGGVEPVPALGCQAGYWGYWFSTGVPVARSS